jgi:methionyl-tRNA formyltransferase
MGTPEFALPTLESLCANYPVVGVVTQPDRPAGRGRRLESPPVKQLALAEGIPVYQPKRLRNLEAVEKVRSWSPDLIIVAAFGQILPGSVLEIPRFGVLNIHPSLLPRWRGAAPIQAAILAGDAVTGVTVMKMDEGLDTGPIVAQSEVPIGPMETAGELEERLAQLGAELLIEVLPAYLEGELQPQPQPEEGVTVVRRFPKSAAELEWERPAAELARRVRAFAPQPGAYTTWDGRRLKVLQARALAPTETPAAEPGVTFVWEEMPAVVTGEGGLLLLHLQMAGKRPMSGDAFLRGRREFEGARLGSR